MFQRAKTQMRLLAFEKYENYQFDQFLAKLLIKVFRNLILIIISLNNNHF